jgi:hypothetical protein
MKINFSRNLIAISLRRSVPGSFIIFFCSVTCFAQDRCGTVVYSNSLKDRKLVREDAQEFEQWLNGKMEGAHSRVNTASSLLRIPVVIHVVHNGEAVGVGTNISEAQILSQIKVLNHDFKRLNRDTLKTPTEFSAIAGGLNIEFVLAKQSPEGVSTNGIIRVRGTKSQWTINDNGALKALSYWPAEDYLNIWVTDISSTILGYAQFPVSDLPGLEDAEDNRLTDGVVLDYRIIGSNDDGSFNLTSNFNKGRTATHEVGHFFGLRHIWGDDDGQCSGSGDYVDDTPDQGNSTNGCPTHPQTSCNAHTMFQNYMDYTNDVCMNLFTQQQVSRMITVIGNSPRRASLARSNGSYDPALVNNDLAIKEIKSPLASECIGSMSPRIVLMNNGLNKVMLAKIQLTVNASVVETKEFSLSSLDMLETAEVSFSPLIFSSGSNIVSFDILQTNSTTDGKANDNKMTITTVVPQQVRSPFIENFDTMPSSWNVKNADHQTAWTIVQTNRVNNLSNKAAYLDFYQDQLAEGEEDILTTPVIDLSQAKSPFVSFDVAYANYPSRSDGLEVHVLLNCSNDITGSPKVYDKQGSSLATAPSTMISFNPSGESQWRKEIIDLRDFIGQSSIQLAFVGINDNGNNLYLDNVAFKADVSEDIAITQVTHPSPVHCSDEVQPSIVIENKGDEAITNFKILYSVNDGNTQTMPVFENFNLSPGAETTITFPVLSLVEGENSLSFELVEPNGFGDVNPIDNVKKFKTIFHNAEDKIPLRENFDNEFENQWSIINPDGSVVWEEAVTNYNRSLYVNGYSSGSTATGDAWLVSPVLDFSDAFTASVFFDVSYRLKNMDSIREPGDDVFKVIASKDCGEIYDQVLFLQDEIDLGRENSEVAWAPSEPGDWDRRYINLNALAGEKDVRIAFVLKNIISNNLYIDNLEFFVSDNPSPTVITSNLYSLYMDENEIGKNFNITFNLDNRQAVTCELVDMMGRQIATKEFSDVLNQTFNFNCENISTGIYLVRLLIDDTYYVSRILVSQ